jgi:hypothetical protein
MKCLRCGLEITKWHPATPDDIDIHANRQDCIVELRAENERLCTVALALCETLRHWYDNGGYECDSKQHQDLEITLGNTAMMIGHKAALDAAGGE